MLSYTIVSQNFYIYAQSSYISEFLVKLCVGFPYCFIFKRELEAILLQKFSDSGVVSILRNIMQNSSRTKIYIIKWR